MGFFEQVRAAFSASPDSSLRTLGVNVKQAKGEWWQVVCPLCNDKGGSASLSHKSGYLKCHQCGREQDLFEWTAELWGCDSWSACQKLCGDFNISLAVKRPTGGQMPRSMKASYLRSGTVDLWTKDDAEPLRKFLRERKLDDAKLLERFGVFYMKGELCFAQFDHHNGGKLKACYRRYRPYDTRAKWGWVGSDVSGFWPYWQVPDDGEIWILEGEWDVATAWMRLRLQEQGIYCFTWTNQSAAITGVQVPKSWHEKKVTLLYDNDTWQGEGKPRAPTEKQLKDQERRYKKLLSHAQGFFANNCPTFLRHIPIDPLEIYGADLRDWVNQGNADIGKLGGEIPFKDFNPREPEPKDVAFAEVFEHPGQRVRTKAVVDTIITQDRALPETTEIDCEMASVPACRTCLVPSRFPTQVIHWSDYPKELAEAMISRNFEHTAQRTLLGMPKNCPRCALNHAAHKPASIWTAVFDHEGSVGKELTVVSVDTPSLSNEVEVEGYVRPWAAQNTQMLMAQKVTHHDQTNVDLSKIVVDLKQRVPESDDVEAIDAYLRKRAADLAYNVTHIHGRTDLHIAIDLLMHSSIGYIYNEMVQRGWLDIGVVGDTRTGKTVVVEQLFSWLGLGRLIKPGSDISRAGLTMGSVPGGTRGSYRLRPGLFPREHKKLLVLDEFQTCSEMNEHPILLLQSARDKGVVDSVKVTGTRQLPAAVRFATMSNWPRRRGLHKCQSFLGLYERPECLSRCDFVLVVDKDPDHGPIEMPSEWSEDLARKLVLRAWAMDPDQVLIDPQAHALAQEFIEECRDVFSEKIPLFTGEATRYSLMRQATAVANLCFSYQPENYYAAAVRRGHMQWAINWLRRTWELCEYDKFSENEVRRHQLRKEFECEYYLTGKIKLEDPESAALALQDFLSAFTVGELSTLTRFERVDAEKWFSVLVRNGCFVKDESVIKNSPLYEPTRGGETMLRNLIKMAEEQPETFRTRQHKLKVWMERGANGKPNLDPITLPYEILIHDEDRQQGAGSDQQTGEIPF